MPHSKSEMYMMQAVRVSFAGNVILFAIKLGALFFVNSLAIATDFGISFVALAVSIILFHTTRLAHRPADPLHNYGYTKIENVCEAMEGIVLVGIALGMSFQAAMNFFHTEEIRYPWVGFGISALGILINAVGTVYIYRMAKKSNSPSIRAEAFHYGLEGVISITVTLSFLLSIIAEAKGYGAIRPYIDPAATILVAILIIIPSFALAKEAFFKLLDASIEEGGKMDVLKHLCLHADKYCSFKDIRTRVSGKKKFVELKVIIPDHISVRDGHRVASLIEESIRTGIVDSEVLVKMEPCDKRCVYVRQAKQCPYTDRE